jgi:type VI secretion system protein ImpF
MTRVLSSTQEARPSLLDRLLDRSLDKEPGVQRGPRRGYGQDLQDLQDAVRRDLENLLNTRRRCEAWPAECKTLEHSLTNYGLPDFMGMSLVSPEGREAFRQLLEKVIRLCETRLDKVKVSLLDNAEPLDRTLRFRIEALLCVEQPPERVAFDSTVEPVTCNFTLKRSEDER